MASIETDEACSTRVAGIISDSKMAGLTGKAHPGCNERQKTKGFLGRAVRA
ncbi:hypothetical protein [Sphingomonas sp. Y38-1Y]|uniref:hypothetical protein n=1 Tax=Sphingomonas sp. Y38-1Y TaxID=3078265 RepID=UPI0028EF0D55|nr:hypothetical protein [Sphingomonas sp. Y38-1Y]